MTLQPPENKVVVKGPTVIMGARKPRYGANQGVSKEVPSKKPVITPGTPVNQPYFAYKIFEEGRCQGGQAGVLTSDGKNRYRRKK
jgi:hypothetical protein